MKSAKIRQWEQTCTCDKFEPGTVLRYGKNKPILFHLWLVSDCGSSRYWICPFTGIVWEAVWVGDWRFDDYDYRRTTYRQSFSEARTVAESELTLYVEGRLPSYFYGFSRPIEFPLEGCRIMGIAPVSRGVLRWQIEEGLGCSAESLWVWIYFDRPMQRGESEQVWVASFLEEVTRQVFTAGREYQVYGEERVMGEMRVVGLREISAEEFSQKFTFDRSLIIL